MIKVVTSWPGVTEGGIVTSGNTVLGANLTYDSLFESERGFKPKEVE